MTSKRLRFDVVMTLSLRHVPVGQKHIDVRMLKKQFDHWFWYWDWNIPRWKFHTNVVPCKHHQGLYSQSGKTSYRKISWSLEAARFGFKLFQLLWNLAGTSAALLPRCLSNFRVIRPLQHPISRLWDFTRFGGKTYYRLVNEAQVIISRHIHDGMTMLDKPQVWVNVFLSATRRIPTTCAISVLLDENELYFYFIRVNSVCQGLNKYEKNSIHIVSH